MFSRWCRGHKDWVKSTLQYCVNDGYIWHRTWLVLGPDEGPNSYWHSRAVSPEFTPNYWNEWTDYVDYCRSISMGIYASGGDLWMEGTDPWQFADQLRNHLDSHVVRFVDAGNEAWQTGQGDPEILASWLDRLQTEILKITTSPEPSDPTNYLIAPSDIASSHSSGPDDIGNIRHIRNALYDRYGQEARGLQDEPRGPGRNVSVMEINAPSVLVGMALGANAIGHQLYGFHSSPGVISDGTPYGNFDSGEEFRNMPGWYDIPKKIAELPPEIVSWKLVHGHQSGAVYVNDNDDTRCDHSISPDGEYVCLIYASENLAAHQARGIQESAEYILGDSRIILCKGHV